MKPTGFDNRAGSVMYTIVAGISSSGKSTYIDTVAGGPRIMDNAIARADDVPHGAFLHYNTLKYANNKLDGANKSFLEDRPLRSIVTSGHRPDVVYVFCGKRELLGRIRSRTTAEDGEGIYPRDDIEAFVRTIDLPGFHQRWLVLLESMANSIRYVCASNGTFTSVARQTVCDGVVERRDTDRLAEYA